MWNKKTQSQGKGPQETQKIRVSQSLGSFQTTKLHIKKLHFLPFEMPHQQLCDILELLNSAFHVFCKF